MNKAVIYARYSTEMQADGKSIEGQILACKEWAQKNNFEIVKIYKDEAISGQSKDRAAFRQIVKDSEKGIFSAVIVHALTRASRFQDLFDYYSWKNALAENNVEIYSATENIQNEEIGDLIEFLSLWQSKKEIVNTRKNVMRTMILNAKDAKFNGGTAPLGYNIDNNNHYIINEYEANIIRLIFDMYVNQEKGYLTIADELNSYGYKTKFGRSFGKNSIREILRNKKYVGIYEYNKTPSRDKNGSRNSHHSKDESDIVVVYDAIPPIIDKEIFDKAQKRIKSRKDKVTNQAIEPYLISGLLYCGNCGSAFSGHHIAAREANYYECIGYKNKKGSCRNKAIQRDFIENHVLNYLKNLNTEKTKKEIAEWFQNEFKQITKNFTDVENQLKTQKRILEIENEKLIDKLLDFDTEAIRNRIIANEKSINQINLELENTKLLKDSQKNITLKKLYSKLRLLENVENLSREKQKELVKMFIKKITLTTNEQGYREIVIFSRIFEIGLNTGDTAICFTLDGAGGRT